MFQTVHLECHQQRSFTLKMHQNRWGLWLRPRSHWGSLQRSPKSPSGIKGPTSKGKGGKVRGEEERGRKGRVRRGEEGLWTLTMLETD